MKKLSKILLLSILGVFFVTGNAMALSIDPSTNITVWDGWAPPGGPDPLPSYEDDEVEPPDV